MQMTRLLFVLSSCLCLYGLTGSSAAETHRVRVGENGFLFSPKSLTIKTGDTVKWIWMTSGHTVTSGTSTTANGIFRSGDPGAQGDSFKVKFTRSFLRANPVAKNRYAYFCEPHGAYGMAGSIKVQSSSSH